MYSSKRTYSKDDHFPIFNFRHQDMTNHNQKLFGRTLLCTLCSHVLCFSSSRSLQLINAKERQCSWPSRPMHCQSSRPTSQNQTKFFNSSYKCYHNVVLNPHQVKDQMSLSEHESCCNVAWKNIPMMAIIAKRPLASSAFSFLVFSAGSDEVKTLNPKSPAAAGVPADWSWETSQNAM